jgi:uncharacterized protein (TIGR03118 family)
MSAIGRNRSVSTSPVTIEPLEKRRLLAAHLEAFVTQTNIVQDSPTANTQFVNAWGIAYGPKTPFWISENGSGQTQVFNTSSNSFVLTVKITAAGPAGGQSAPTGQIFNNDSTAFLVNPNDPKSPAYKFIFAGEDGGISAWAGGAASTLKIDQSAQGSVFKGLAEGTINGTSFLYATDFHNGAVDVFNSTFQPVSMPGAFQDPRIPAGYAPFNVQNVGGNLVVTYAKQDDIAHDDAPGFGHGFVDIYNTSGTLLSHFQHVGALDSPWGVTTAPAGWGNLAGDYLIGQFGSGMIAIYRPDGHFQGLLEGANEKPVLIDGLWALTFGGGTGPTSINGDSNTLYFTAGPGGENHGLFGSLTVGFEQEHGNGDQGDDHNNGKGHDHDDDNSDDDGGDILDNLFADLDA